MSNELLIYTVRKVDSLIGNYETDKDSFENDIIANKNYVRSSRWTLYYEQVYSKIFVTC